MLPAMACKRRAEPGICKNKEDTYPHFMSLLSITLDYERDMCAVMVWLMICLIMDIPA